MFCVHTGRVYFAILIARIQFPLLNSKSGIKTTKIITGGPKNILLKVTIESELDLVSAALIFFAAIIPAYLSLKLRGDIGKVTIALTAFIVLHGIYHVVRMQGLESMADGVFEPASVIMLIAFGATYLGVSRKKKQEAARK